MKPTATYFVTGVVFLSALCMTHSAIAQNNINVDNNFLISNLNNNVNIRGNQQMPAQAQVLNVQVINTIRMTGPNGQGPNGVYTSPVAFSATQAATKPKTPKQVVNKPKPVRPKPTTNLAYVAKPKPKPAKPVVPRRTPVKPVVKQTLVNPPVNVPVIPQVVTNPVSITSPVMAAIPVQNNESEQIQTATTSFTPLVSITSPRPGKLSSGSAGSASSGKSTHHKSKHKKRGGFCYNANKKWTRLFANTRKGNFDPARCFVWK